MAALDFLKENWQKVKAVVKERWGDKISDAELDAVAGQHEQLCHLIGEKCGLNERRAREEINKILDGIYVSSSHL